MFSENNRISGRQMYRLMTYDLLGIGTLLVPQMLAKTAGRDGILSIGIGMAAALAYLWILRRLAPPAQESYPEYMERQLGRIGGGIVQTGYLIYLVLLAGLFVGGCIFNYLNEKSESIYTSWITHMFANFAINTVGFMLFRIG